MLAIHIIGITIKFTFDIDMKKHIAQNTKKEIVCNMTLSNNKSEKTNAGK
jgi:hypothetical protein